MATLVYMYGLLPPTSGGEKARQILATAHGYRNMRVEIERGRRAALREIESRVGLGALLAAYAEADAWCQYGYELVRAHKSAERTHKIPALLRERLAECKGWRKQIATELREAKRTIRESFSAEYDAVNARAAELRRNARGYSGLASAGPHFGAHGTYQVVEESTDRLAKRPLYDAKKGWAASDPRYYRRGGILRVHEDGRIDRGALGAIGVQIQGGARPSELSDHPQLQILPRDRPGGVPGSRRSRQARLLRMRVGSTDRSGREGIYVEWPMIMHRPLPDDALVMNARVHVQRVGTREEWFLIMTVRTDTRRAPAERAGAVAVNFGWRRVPTGIRVAAWVGEDGERGEIICPNVPGDCSLRIQKPMGILDRLAHASSIRSLRDDLFNLARPWAALVLASIDAPKWLLHEAKDLAHWRSTMRLSDLVYLWSKRRFEGDGDAFEAFSAWARRDRHLYQYETGERRGTERARREIYRIAAARLAARYSVMVHDEVNFAELKTCPMIEASENDRPRARAHMHAAAPGELRGAIINAFRGDVAVVSGVDITHTCPTCGSVETFDAAIKIHHQCSVCSTLWDQDHAAAENMLDRYISGGRVSASSKKEEKPEGEESDPASNRPSLETPRQKTRRLAKERAARLAAMEKEDDGQAAE